MLSQKLQKDLMNAYAAVHEEKRGHASGDSDVEKQASQLASDVRYKAKGKVKPGASDEEKKKVMIQILGASPAPNAVKAMAKSKLLGEAKEEGGMISNVSKSLVRNQRRFGDTGSTEPTGSTGQGMSSAAKMSLERQKETKEKRGVKTTGPQADKMNNSYEPEGEVIDEMRFNDGKKGTEKRKEALRKKRGLTKDQMDKHPQFKTEGKSYGITKGDGMSFPERLKKKAKEKKVKMEGYMSKDKYTHDTGGFRISQKDADEAKARIKKKMKKEEVELGEMSHSTSKKPKEKKMSASLLDNIRKVNTGAGSQYEEVIHEKKAKKDYDGDGKVESGTQEFLGSRDKAIKKAIAKRRGRVKEGFSAWRIDLDFQESVKK